MLNLLSPGRGSVERRIGPVRRYVGRLVDGKTYFGLAFSTIFAVALCVCGFSSAASALASKTVVNHLGNFRITAGVQGSGTKGGLFNESRGVAVNQTGAGGVPAGTFYVVDSANGRVQQFSPTADFVRTWGWGVKDGEAEFEHCSVAANCRKGLVGSGAGEFNIPQGVAVDQARGIVYVTDEENHRVDAFSANGVFEGAFGWGVLDGSGALQFCTAASGCAGPGETGGAAGQLGSFIGYPAVDSSGHVFVADPSNSRIDVFTPTIVSGAIVGISFLHAFGWDVAEAGDPGDTISGEFEVCTTICKAGLEGGGLGQFGFLSPFDVSLDSSGNVYALENQFGNNRVQKFDSTPAPLEAEFGSPALSSLFEGGELLNIAVDANDHVLVSGKRASDSNRPAVAELDSSGASVDTHGADIAVGTSGASTSGLAVAPASLGGNVYLSFSSSEGVGHLVFILNEAPIVEPVTIHTGTTATFEGEVVSNEFEVEYHFEYSPDGEHWTSLPTESISAGAASGKEAVSQSAEGLTGSQLYHVRLAQFRPLGGGRATSTEQTFTTDAAAPAITGTAASDITDTTATLRATLDAQHQLTEYHFEYGDQGPCDSNPCTSTAEFSAGSGGGGTPVAKQVSDLEPATKYFFRLVATNGDGTTLGNGASFTTYPDQTPDTNCENQPLRTGLSAALPDCRAYELVTPEDTGGHSPTMQATNGEAQFFPTPFASPSGERVLFKTKLGALPGTDGSGVSDPYDAQRGTDGWESTLVGPSGALSENPSAGGFSSDHELGFFRFHGKLGSLDGPGVEGGAGYLRLPDGSFEPIGRGELEDKTPTSDTATAIGYRITAGGAHIVFDSTAHLESNTPPTGERAVYDRSLGGATRVISLLPGNAVPAESSFFQGMSADGSTTLFSNPGTSFSIDSGITLYARLDNTETVEVATGTGGTVTPAGVSADGKAVFYLKNGNAFSFDTVGHSTTQITTVGNAALVNISEDGSHVYFVSTSQIGGEGIAGQPNLYVWERSGGTTSFIATVEFADLNSGFPAAGLARWTTDVASPTFPGGRGPLNDTSRTTPDGSVIVFQSKAKLTTFENAGHTEIYRYHTGDAGPTCVSCDPTGTVATHSDASLAQRKNGFSATLPINPFAVIPNLSEDGRTVFFESEEALAPGDVDGVRDVYEWHEGRISLISSGHSTLPNTNFIWGATPDGHDVFFYTNDTLLGRDHNGGSGAVYDARIGGGFAEPVVQPACQGDACQGQAGAKPGGGGVGSVGFVGVGNVKEGRRQRCRRGQVRRHRRCVARHHKHKQRRANRNGGAGR